MKLRTLILLMACTITLSSQAQNWSTENYKYGELYPGYIVLADGEKITGHVKYRNRVVMQDEVIFYKNPENPKTKKKYYPKDLKEYKVADKRYYVLSYGGSMNNQSKKGVLLVKEGCITEHLWYKKADNYNMLIKGEGETDEEFGNRKFPSKSVFYKKGDDIPVEPVFFEAKFGKTMASYVSDNKELSSKMKKTDMKPTLHNLRKVFQEYNEGCK